MRTTILLASLGLLAAAEQPKPTPKLNTAEVTALNAVGSRLDALRKEYEALTKQESEIRADACRRALDLPTCEIRPDGTLHKPEAPKPEVEK